MVDSYKNVGASAIGYIVVRGLCTKTRKSTARELLFSAEEGSSDLKEYREASFDRSGRGGVGKKFLTDFARHCGRYVK